MKKFNLKKLGMSYALSFVGVFLFFLLLCDATLKQAVTYAFFGGFLVPLCLWFMRTSDPNNTTSQAFWYEGLYNTDLSTGRVIAELEKLNRNTDHQDK